MMDLERVLPAGVQVTSIEPATSKTGEVSIRLKVSGDRERAVQLVRNLEKSQRFVGPRLAGESAQAQETGRATASPVGMGAVEFDILSGYNPLPAITVKADETTQNDEDSQVKPDEPLKVSRHARGAKAAPPSQRPMIGGAR
jgi:type IV pilus assembly protein PilN